MGKKQKYYVVWKGKKTGVFTSWKICKEQVDGFEGAQYKSFSNLNEAVIASEKSFADYKGVDTKKTVLSSTEKEKYGNPILNSIAVDAACAGNPGKLEYQGVYTKTKQVLFKKGPFTNGTNNIGEFLAIVHALAFLKKEKKEDFLIYTDSKTALSWIRQKKCKSKLIFNQSNTELKNLVERAEFWLQNNTYKNPIQKWHTKAWGEIPADFGRK